STGDPKGVLLTHANILANVEPLAAELRSYRPWERFVHPIRVLGLPPLSHVFGQFASIFLPPILRSEVVFLDAANPSEVIDASRRHRVTAAAVVPGTLESLKSKVEREAEGAGELDRFRRALERADQWSIVRRAW